MSKLETVKSLSAQRSKAISEQINELRSLQNSSVESLAQQLEPLAQSLATLSDEARESIMGIVRESAKQQKMSAEQWQSAADKWSDATSSLSKERKALESAADQITTNTAKANRQLRGVTWRVWIAALTASLLLSLALISAYMIWQPPLSIQEKKAVRYYNAISPADQQRIQEIVRDNNL